VLACALGDKALAFDAPGVSISSSDMIPVICKMSDKTLFPTPELPVAGALFPEVDPEGRFPVGPADEEGTPLAVAVVVVVDVVVEDMS